MIKRFLILILLVSIVAGITGCGGGNSSISTPDGVNPGVVSRVEVMATSYVNQTNGYCYLKTKVIDGNGAPIVNRQVVWTNLTTLGVLNTTTSMTDQNGIASATLYSTTSGFATVQAEVNANNSGTEKIRDRKTVYFTPYDMCWPGLCDVTQTDDRSSVGLDVDSNNNNVFNETSDFILLDPPGKTDAIVRATVKDSSGAPLLNSAVTFGSDSPDVSFPLGSSKTAPVVHTNSDGQASVMARVSPTVLSNNVTTVNITASAVVDSSTTPPKTRANVVTLFLQPVTISSITVTANPTTVVSGGTSEISAVVRTTAGLAPPSGTIVTFSTSRSTTFAATDSTGLAKVTFTAPTVTTNTSVTVTASVGGKSGSTTVEVTAPSTALTVIPFTRTIVNPIVGNTATFTISGGKAPYLAVSDDPSLIQVSVTGSTLTAMVANVPAADTTVNINVYDSVGASSVIVTVKLQVTAAATLTVTPNPPTPVMGIPNPDGNIADDLTFTISGGTGPYTVTSSNAVVIASPGLLGAGVTQFTVDPNSVSVSTQVNLFVSDSAGAVASVPVTVNPLILTITLDKYNVIGRPNSANSASNLVTFTVMGGTGPYIVTSDNPALTPTGTWSSSTAPFSSSFYANNVGSVTNVALTVYDNAGATATATLQIFPQTTGLVISVNKLDVIGLVNPDGNSTDDVTFTVTGGMPPYLISDGGTCTPNPGLSPASPWSIAVNGGTITVDPGKPTGGSTVTCILTVTDNVGSQSSTAFTVHP